MKTTSIWGGVILITWIMAGTALAADNIASGKVKSVNAERKEFVLTDTGGRDFTFKLSEQTIMNRSGSESQTDLRDTDLINVFFERGLLQWTAKYILIREGDSKNWELTHGKLKGFDGEKRYFTYTDDKGGDLTYSAAFARAWLNQREVAFDDLQIGDAVLLIVSRDGGKTNLVSVMAERLEK